MSLPDRLRPPPRAPRRLPAPDALRELVEVAADCEAAALGLVEMLERRNVVVSAAIAAGAIKPALGKRMLSREAVDRALHAAGLCAHAGIPRSASTHRIGFSGQVVQAVNAGKGERHGATE